MPVMRCAKERCQRMISVSMIPDGNPTAKASPEIFSQGYKQCTDLERCGAYHCDRHWGGKCVKCGSPLTPVRWGPETPGELEYLRKSEETLMGQTRSTPESRQTTSLQPEQVAADIDAFARQAPRGHAQTRIPILQMENLHNNLLHSLCKGDVEMVTADLIDRIYDALSGECPRCTTKYPGDILRLVVLMQASPEYAKKELEKHEGSQPVISLIQQVAEGHCVNSGCSSQEIVIYWQGSGF